MQKVITVIYDHKVNAYDNCAVSINLDVAKRDLGAALKCSKDSVLFQYPEDFDLFVIGYLDTETGAITAKHEFVGNLTAFIDKEA